LKDEIASQRNKKGEKSACKVVVARIFMVDARFNYPYSPLRLDYLTLLAHGPLKLTFTHFTKPDICYGSDTSFFVESPVIGIIVPASNVRS